MINTIGGLMPWDPSFMRIESALYEDWE